MSADTPVNNAGAVQLGNYVPRQSLPGCETFIQQLTARIPISKIETDIQTRRQLRPSLNWMHLTGIGLGGIIGMGIFVLSGKAAAEFAGPSVIITFIITGIVALLAAISLSELASMMPLAGAAYTYTYAALGEYMAWFIGWNYALLYQLATLTVVVGWTKHVVHLIDVVSDYNATTWLVKPPVAWNEDTQQFFVTGGAINLPAIVITIAITGLLILGIKQTAIVNLVLVVFKIIVLLIFIFATCKYVNRDNYVPFIPSNQGSFDAFGVSGMARACTYVFFAYVGFESIATVTEEADPRTRPLPYAIIGSVVISFLIYIGICTVIVGLVPYSSLNSDSPLSDAIKATPYGLWLSVLMDLGGLAGTTTVALTMLLAQTRIFYAMAQDGLLPSFFAKTHNRTETPWISTIISGTICAVIAGICPIDIVGETTSISALITYLFIHIEVIVMRYTHRDLHRPFRVPFGPWLIPVIGALLCIALMIGIKAATAYRFLVWTLIGQIVYFSYGFWHSNRRQQRRRQSDNSAIELVATVERTSSAYENNKSELGVSNNAADIKV